MHLSQRIVIMALSSALVLSNAAPAEAGLGSWLTKAAKAAGSKIQRVFGKGSSKAGQKSTTTLSRSASGAAGRLGHAAGTTVSRGSRAVADASQTVLTKLGTRGAMAMQRLSPQATVRLGQMSSLIARSPHQAGWLETIAKHGNSAVNWLWANKGSIAVGTAAGAAILKPADFLQTMGGVAEASIETVGKHVAAPVMDGVASGIATPVGKAIGQRISSDPWWWLYPYLTVGSIVGYVWYRRRRRAAQPTD